MSPIRRVLRSLADAPSAGYGHETIVRKSNKSGGETLYWGNRSGVVRLYDKHAESDGAAPEGTVRFEVEARRNWARRYFPTVRDLDQTAASRIAKDMWTRSGFGTPFRPLPQWLSSVVEDQTLSPAALRGFVGYVLLRDYGISMRASPTTQAKYKRLIDVHGMPATDDGLKSMSNLDLESGVEVVERASSVPPDSALSRWA